MPRSLPIYNQVFHGRKSILTKQMKSLREITVPSGSLNSFGLSLIATLKEGDIPPL